VLGPRVSDLIEVLLDQVLSLGHLLRLETEICRELHAGVDPELGFAIGMLT